MDFNIWKHHPVSKFVLQYLLDKRQFIERAALEQWLDGSLSLVSDQCLRGQIIELFEMTNLPFEAIASFYGEEAKDKDGAETT